MGWFPVSSSHVRKYCKLSCENCTLRCILRKTRKTAVSIGHKQEGIENAAILRPTSSQLGTISTIKKRRHGKRTGP